MSGQRFNMDGRMGGTMTRVRIDGDEWYPVYTILEDQSDDGWCYGIAELTDYEVRMVETYTRGFQEMQELIAERLEANP